MAPQLDLNGLHRPAGSPGPDGPGDGGGDSTAQPTVPLRSQRFEWPAGYQTRSEERDRDAEPSQRVAIIQRSTWLFMYKV